MTVLNTRFDNNSGTLQLWAYTNEKNLVTMPCLSYPISSVARE